MRKIPGSRRQGRRIETLVAMAPTNGKHSGKRVTAEEDAFIREKIAAGLNNIEIQRMFFRRFDRDVSASTIKHRR